MGVCVECHGGFTIVDVDAVQEKQGIVLPDPEDEATIQQVFAKACDAELELYCGDNCPIGADGLRACAAKTLGNKPVQNAIAPGVTARIFVLSAKIL